MKNKKINKKNNNKKVNKKIESEFAIGIILLVAIMVGGTFWIYESRQLVENQKISQTVMPLSKQKSQIKKADSVIQEDADLCTPHYYEGESRVQVWLISNDQNDKNSITVQLKNGEDKKLPGNNVVKNANSTVRLVDPTAGVRKGLLTSSKEKPVSITIRGYAEICEQPPLVSLREATVAFKKS